MLIVCLHFSLHEIFILNMRIIYNICKYRHYYYSVVVFLVQQTFAMLHAVTNLFLATRSNECTLFATLWAMIASPQPKSATTCNVDLNTRRKILLFWPTELPLFKFLRWSPRRTFLPLLQPFYDLVDRTDWPQFDLVGETSVINIKQVWIFRKHCYCLIACCSV